MRKTQVYKILFLTIFWECFFLFLIFFKGFITDYKCLKLDKNMPYEF